MNKTKNKWVVSAASAALVASAIVPVASAASFSDIENSDHKDAILALAEAGIISGYTDGTFKPNAVVTRGNVAKLLGKWLVSEGYEIPEDYNTVERFTDLPVDSADQELVKYAALVKDAGVFKGSNNQLMQTNNMSREQMAVVLVRALNTVYGVDLVADYKAADFESKITDLDKANADENREAIIALEYAEITKVTAFNPKNSVTRGQFASFLHRAIENVGEKEVTEVKVESVEAVSTKALEVKFNTAVEKTEEAAFEVLKGSSTGITVTSVTWSEDKTVAKLTLASKIGEGKYTVNVTGVGEETLTGSVETQAETVASVEIASDLAIMSGTNLTVGYKVLNQYGEDITSKVSTGDLTPSATNGASTVSLNGTTGVATIDNSTSALKAGDKVTLTIVHNGTGKVATKQLTVSATAAVADLSFGELYNEDGLELSQDNTAETFYVKVDAKDQYGNALKSTDLNANSVVLTSSRSDVLKATTSDFKTIKIDGKDTVVLQLDAANMTEGKTTFTLVSLYNGKTATKEFTVKAATKVDTISLSAPELAVAGETVSIPFSAVNNQGEEATSVSQLNGVTVTASTGTGLTGTIKNPTFKKNASTGKVELLLDLSTITAGKGKVTLVATTPTGKVTTLSVDVKEEAAPKAITGLKDINLNHVAGESVSIGFENLVFVDQYERVMTNSAIAADFAATPTAAGEYSIKVESSDTAVATVSAAELVSGQAVTLNGVTKGNVDVTFTIQTHDGKSVVDVAGSDYTKTARIAQATEFVSYEASTVETVYDDSTSTTDAYERKLEVYGVLANGTKVVLPASAYNVVVSGQEGVTATAGNNAFDINVEAAKQASPIKYATDATEAKATATVTINATGETLTKEFTISKVAPKVEAITFTSSVVKGGFDLNTATTFGTAEVTGLIDATKTLDTYGEAVTVADGEITFASGAKTPVYYTISDIVDANKTVGLTVTGNGTKAFAISNIETGDSFRVTVKADNATATFSASN